MATLNGFRAEDLDAILAFHTQIANPEKRLNRSELRSLLTDAAHSYGKNVVWMSQNENVGGVAGWVTGGSGEFFASPLWAPDQSTAKVLTDYLISQARRVAASWMRVTTLVTETHKTIVLEELGFARIFDFVEFRWTSQEFEELSNLPLSFQELRGSAVDLSKLLKLINLSFEGVDNSLPMNEEQVAELWKPESCDHRLSRVWVDNSGHYVGFVIVTPRGYIDSIGVAPSFQRRGIAKSLYQSLLRDAHHLSIDCIHTIVSSRNQASLCLHERLGFQVAERRPVWELSQ